MQAVSANWAPALASAHGLTAKVDVLYDGAVIASDVQIAGGSVKLDGGSDIRSSLSLTIADPSEFPKTPTDRWGVYGQRISVSAGIIYTDGTIERVMLGEFVTVSVGGDIHQGPLQIEAQGKEILLKRAVTEGAVSTSGVSVSGWISSLVDTHAPGESYVNNSTHGGNAVPTKTYDAGTEVLTVINEAATSIGAEFLCNMDGTFELRDITDPATAAPVWAVDAGSTGVLVSADIDLTSEDVFNNVVVSGENTEENVAPVTAVWQIQGPTDPLSVDGPFGKVTKRYSSSLITTLPQALETAKRLLHKYRAANRTVSLTAIHNHAIEPGDCIAVRYGGAVPDETHLVRTIDHPLTAAHPTTVIETVSGRDEEDPEA